MALLGADDFCCGARNLYAALTAASNFDRCHSLLLAVSATGGAHKRPRPSENLTSMGKFSASTGVLGQERFWNIEFQNRFGPSGTLAPTPGGLFTASVVLLYPVGASGPYTTHGRSGGWNGEGMPCRETAGKAVSAFGMRSLYYVNRQRPRKNLKLEMDKIQLKINNQKEKIA